MTSSLPTDRANKAALAAMLAEEAAYDDLVEALRNAQTLIRSNTDDAVEQAWHAQARSALARVKR